MTKWILGVIAILLLAGGWYMRTQNIAEASRRIQPVIQADTAGQDTKVALESLKGFVATHMGARADFTLQASYDRAQAAAQAAANAQAANSKIYADAQRVCGTKADSITLAHCNQDYLAKHLVTMTSPTPVTAPRLADYQYKLRSPFWTPDIAGALFLGGVAALGFVAFGLARSRRR